MTTFSLRAVVRSAAFIALVSVPRPTQAQDSIAVARDLYAAAAYEDALVVLNRLDSSSGQPSDRVAINQYRAFCFVALRRTGEAEQAIEAILSAEPLYHPTDADASPRLLSAFASVRQRILPAIVQQKYAHARAAFERQEFSAAGAEFDQVLQALGDADLGDAGNRPPLADLRTLAVGFRDLSVRAATPAPAPVPAPAPAAPVPMPQPPVANQIYNLGDPNVSPPVIVRQDLPPFSATVIPAGQGVLEVIINETGTVETATMRTAMNPRYDALVVSATRSWTFKPATVSGTPVRFRKLISISVKPGT